MTTQIDTAFKMGCMAVAGYGIGTALKVNPKAMAITWLCGEVALQVFRKVKHLPLPKILAGSFVSLHLSAQQLIENRARSHSITIGAFVISSLLIDNSTNLLNRLWRVARDAYQNEDVYPMAEPRREDRYERRY